MQELFAPFVLENLDCDGSEERLVDCPGAMVERSYPGDPNAYSTAYEVAVRVSGCENTVTSAASLFVACGTLSGPGANGHVMRSSAMHDCTYAAPHIHQRNRCAPKAMLDIH